MKNIFIIALVFLSINVYGQYSPYQKENIRIAAYFSKQYGIPIKHLLSVAEVNTNGGRNEFQKIKNPFKIKCYSTNCRYGHCINIDKKQHKVFYRVFHDVSNSYRTYCKLKRK